MVIRVVGIDMTRETARMIVRGWLAGTEQLEKSVGMSLILWSILFQKKSRDSRFRDRKMFRRDDDIEPVLYNSYLSKSRNSAHHRGTSRQLPQTKSMEMQWHEQCNKRCRITSRSAALLADLPTIKPSQSSA
ncbi:hypothetical protein IG631_24080 [Alternaria alternata]|nr:hypothetical protein IG631_24080 [Alternaria alternata]